MSLNGKKRPWTFWGSLAVVILIALCAVVAAGIPVWNSIDPYWDPAAPKGDLARYRHPRFFLPLGAGIVAAVLPLVNQHMTAKRATINGEFVAAKAFEVLQDLEMAMGRLSADDKYQAYFDDLIKKCGPKLFQGRDVRIGFFILEGGESEDLADLSYLRKRAAYERSNVMPITYIVGTTDADGRDQAAEMISRAKAGKDLWVKDIYRDSTGWTRRKKVRKTAYRCFISAPVTDASKSRSLGLLTVDAAEVGDLTESDGEWVRILAGMLSHGLRDEVAEVPKPTKPA
ncbi:hypothetical protein ACX80W_01900 [Arthrobacter sp. TMN-37]